MAFSPIQDLHLFLQSYLRENPSFLFRDVPVNRFQRRVILTIGVQSFIGTSPTSAVAARNNAAQNALNRVRSMTDEGELRSFLGLRARASLAEFDNIRDQLRSVKQRIKAGVADRRTANREVGLLYEKLDSVERRLMYLGL